MWQFLIGSLILFAVFLALERAAPERPQPRWRADFRTDLAWWLLTPCANRLLAPLFAGLGILGLTAVAGRPGEVWIGTWPTALQIAAIFVAGDFIGYWLHRAFHRQRWLWKVHEIHHSSEELDWLSSFRVHPVNQMLQIGTRAMLLYWMGFPLAITAAYAPILSVYAVLVHANLPWRFGPLGYVIASPAFHRWHHAREPHDGGCNFATLFPAWDYAFGTAWFPAEAPEHFGLPERPVPAGVWGQLVHPFRRPGAPA